MSVNEVTVNIKLYGILNRYVQKDEHISLKIPGICSYALFIENLYQLLSKNTNLEPEKQTELRKLIESSALARNDEIFDATDHHLQLQQNDFISVLPPVCGG